MCACGFIKISGNTVGIYQRNLQQCHVSLSFSDSPVLFTSSVCPAPDGMHLSQSSLTLSLFSLAGTELFVVLVESICLLSERMVYTSVGEGVRQRCQRAQWVKG